jgi:hypothetical protein
MKKKILIIMAGLLLISLNVFADDVSIDSSGNVKTGVANTNAELEVTGGSAEGAIRGMTSGTGASGVYGINTTYSDFGILGYYGYGVYGFSSSGYAGYFDGNARVTGNLTVDGNVSGTLQQRVTGTCAAGSSISTINSNGSVVCETDDNSGGTVTQVNTGSGLTGGPITGTGTISLSSSYIDGSALDGRFVNIAGDTMTGPLTVSGAISAYGYKIGTTTVLSTPSDNTFLGQSVGIYTTGDYNTFVGKRTGISNSTGSSNTFLGNIAGYKNTTGNNNTFLGVEAGYMNTTGYLNTFLGVDAGMQNDTGYDNTASGVNALFANTTGFFNTATGKGALANNTTGNTNTASGRDALLSNTTGSYNTALGNSADVASNNLSNATAIGYGAIVNASNKVVIGNTSVTSIGGYAAWSNYSDLRAKTDIQDIGYGLDLIRQLRPVSFKMKNGNGNTDFGFVAQDIESLLGENYNVLDIGGGDERMLSLRYSQFIAPMVKAIQEQQGIINSQQEQLNELKAIIEELKKRL